MRFRFPIFALPPQAEALRREVRAFLEEERAAGKWRGGGDFATHYDPAFSRRLGARGWLGMTWPRRYGGGERSTLERLVLSEELLAANAPVAAHWIADRPGGAPPPPQEKPPPTNPPTAIKPGPPLGYGGVVEGMAARLKEEMAPAAVKVIATGGMAGLIAPHAPCIEGVEPMLTLEGLRLIHERHNA